VIEIRWHARAGQGAKTASQVLAIALLRSGRSVQAFPEYGPERRGAPVRAFTRFDDRPIRRHDSVEEPDAVVVLEPSLAAEAREGLRPDALFLCVDAGGHAPNLFALGALAAALGEPPLEALVAAATEVLGTKVDARALRAALEAGYAQEAATWAA
jgi:pyruvate ferredoxin oxidoreductase gamma subunit